METKALYSAVKHALKLHGSVDSRKELAAVEAEEKANEAQAKIDNPVPIPESIKTPEKEAEPLPV